MPGRHRLVCFPRVRLLLAHALLAAATCTQAAEPSYFKFSDLMNSDSGRALHDPAVKLYWATQPTPEFAEVAPHRCLCPARPLLQRRRAGVLRGGV